MRKQSLIYWIYASTPNIIHNPLNQPKFSYTTPLHKALHKPISAFLSINYDTNTRIVSASLLSNSSCRMKGCEVDWLGI